MDKVDITDELKEAFKSEEDLIKWVYSAIFSRRQYKMKIIPESPPPTEWEQMTEAREAWREITSARGATKTYINVNA